MAELVEILLTFLNVDLSNTYVRETLRAGPIDSLFYLVFFPTVFIILFVYILTNWVLKKAGNETKGLRLLISIAFYAFIILQGWFLLFISVSRVWFVVIVLLAGFWVFTHHFVRREGGGGGGGPGGGMPAYGGGKRKQQGVGGYISTKLQNVIKNDEEDIEKRIRDRMGNMEAIIHSMKNSKPGTDLGMLYNSFWAIKREAESAIDALADRIKVYGIKVEKKRTDDYWDKITDLTEEMKKAFKHASRGEDFTKGRKKAA